MSTVELLERALMAAEELGYRVRHEYLGGVATGVCEMRGQKWLFVDLASNASEQLDQVVASLRGDPALPRLPLPGELRRAFGLRRAA